MGIDTMVPIPNNLYIFDKTTQKTVFASAINEYLKKECINIFRDLNANDFKNSLEKQVLTYTKGNVERSFERILSPTGWGLKEYVPLANAKKIRENKHNKNHLYYWLLSI